MNLLKWDNGKLGKCKMKKSYIFIYIQSETVQNPTVDLSRFNEEILNAFKIINKSPMNIRETLC